MAVVGGPAPGGNPPPREVEGPQPTDYLPVMRYHLYLACIALEAAFNKEAAEDVIQALREGRDVPKESTLSRRLRVSLTQLDTYLKESEIEEEQEQEELPKLSAEQILEAREAVRQGRVPEELASNFFGEGNDGLPE